jgi:hypothetical protein
MWASRSRQALKIFVLRDDGAAYEAVSQSRLLPDLDIALLEYCVASVHGNRPVARFAPASTAATDR